MEEKRATDYFSVQLLPNLFPDTSKTYKLELVTCKTKLSIFYIKIIFIHITFPLWQKNLTKKENTLHVIILTKSIAQKDSKYQI